ncbi:unnamed protein product [Cladocopium goreaui]|uniref:Metacaspase-1 n=1 Tax=Cladocopium goreaui TaxID=2562237 RepID=A0A9P1BJT7_9DINO|nr:unnamed protein product [Cladocopium goreaui]CAI3974724.1 unnamed protein product [Cladocopium goreaui]
MQLEIVVVKAAGLKHDGRHCVEFLLDGHGPERTPWVEDFYDGAGMVVQPKNFQNSKRTIALKGSLANYEGAFLHMTLYHQRTLRDDKRAAEAHLPFSRIAKGFSGWVALEHKEKYGGKVFIDVNLKEGVQLPLGPAPVPASDHAAMDPQVAEQMAILASIQSSKSSETHKPHQPKAPQATQAAWPEWPTQAPPTLPISTSQPVAAPAPVALKDAEPPQWLSWPRFRAALDSGSDLRALPGHSTSASGRRKALLIAMNYPGTAAERRCGGNDLDKVTGILLRLGFPDEWILSLSDFREPSGPSTARQIDRPSKANIIAALRWLTHNAVAGDVLFFHYSGHGVLHEDATGELLDAYCPSDFAEAGYLPTRDCYDLISSLPAGVRLTMLADCCVPCACPQLPFLWDAGHKQWMATSLPTGAKADVVGLGGNSEGEMTPLQLAEAQAAEHGPVTGAFLRAMQDLAGQRKGPVTYAELLAEASRHLQGTAQEFLQLSATKLFDPASRTFRFFDAISE